MLHVQRYSLPPQSKLIDFFTNLDLNYFSFVNHFHLVIPPTTFAAFTRSSAVKELILAGQIGSNLGAIWGFLKVTTAKFLVETPRCTSLIHCMSFIILFRTLVPARSAKLC